MATVFLFVFFVLSPLVLLPSAEEEKRNAQSCSSFQCGKFGMIGFPFRLNKRNYYKCGLLPVNCDQTPPTIQLPLGWSKGAYEVINISYTNTTLFTRVKDLSLLEYLNTNKCEYLTNFTLPKSPSISFKLTTPNQSLFKCNRTLDSNSYKKFKYMSCGDHNFYYIHSNESTPSIISSQCSIIQLPVKERSDNNELNLTAEFDLEVHVSPACSSCHGRGGKCFPDSKGKFSCSHDNRKSENKKKVNLLLGFGKLQDGREVAVKRLYGHNYRRVQQFINEVEILTRLRHKNLVSLYGCTSRHCRELLLVYEYIPNGTVADHIYGNRATPGSLTWPTRMRIAIETASALAYLHASDIIHRDIKTNNILLDDNFFIKVADFGLSRLFPNDVSHVSTSPQGTPGYVDPEYHQCYQLTSKSDVYSFGVVLIELISSLPAVDILRHKHEINLANFAKNKIEKSAFHELIDPHLGFESDDGVRTMTILVAKLAFQCLQQDKEMRPSMDEVLVALKKIQCGDDVPEQSASPYRDEVGLLKNKRQPLPPEAVTDNWTSRSATPNVSG